MKRIAILFMLTVATVACTAYDPPPDIGVTASPLQRNDAGEMLVDFDNPSDVAAAYKEVTKCVTPDEWVTALLAAKHGDEIKVFDTGDMISPETADGNTVSAIYSCGHSIRDNHNGTATLCEVCCSLVRKCAQTPQGTICWLEVQCSAPQCMTGRITN